MTKKARPAKGKSSQKLKEAQSASKREVTQIFEDIIHPNAAGVDIGAEELVAAVDPAKDKDGQPVRTFCTFTGDLHRLAQWLVACGVDTVAMESTGNYWISPYLILEDAGLEVILVNARHVKNVPGKKTDVCDAQWLRKLHAAGLLRGSFRPSRQIAPLRYLMRHRAGLVRDAGQIIQRMQKVLTEMNLKLHHVFSDLDGLSAQLIIEAIVAGQRDPEALWQLRDPRCKSPKEKFMAAIEGDWRQEYLFVLGQCQKAWRAKQADIHECDQQIEAFLGRLGQQLEPALQGQLQPQATESAPATQKRRGPKPKADKKTPARKNQPPAIFQAEGLRFYGVDLTTLEGISTGVLSVLMAEVGPRQNLLEAFPTAARFCSWLALCPDNRVSAGKTLSTKTRKTTNRLNAALRLAAHALTHSKGPMGDYCRRMKARLGKAEGTTAVAHKLARILYAMIVSRSPFDPQKCFELSPAKKAKKLKTMAKAAEKLGFQLIPIGVT